MKLIYTTLTVIILSFSPLFLKAQEVKSSDFGIDFGGYVRYEMFYDTYNSIDSRDGNIYLYPMRPSEDLNGEDINKTGQLEMLALQTRLSGSISGPEAFGAKTSGKIEVDFEGTSQSFSRLIRLRHAFVNLDWGNTELLLGQTWHPMFVASCFPRVLSFGAGLPFQPFSRSPQARLTRHVNDHVSIMLAGLIHGYNRSTGPYEAQRNSGLPDMQFQMKYSQNALHAGVTAGYKFLTPRLVTDLGYKTNETVGSYNFQAFLKIQTSSLIAKLQGVVGENLTNYTMIGGYGIEAGTTDLQGDYTYTNMNTMSVWTEVMTHKKKVNVGLFAGYTENLGFSDELDVSGGSGIIGERNADIAYLYRISPRVVFSSGSMDLGAELMYTGAAYGTQFDEFYKAEESEESSNLRLLISAKYVF